MATEGNALFEVFYIHFYYYYTKLIELCNSFVQNSGRNIETSFRNNGREVFFMSGWRSQKHSLVSVVKISIVRVHHMHYPSAHHAPPSAHHAPRVNNWAGGLWRNG